ncbi:hypothetical protein DFH06DRAFT_986851 [Mycena polygramma]|nr:hypothetical protein DFH06DRAFT_986851 [Mycena polygramma]
MILHRGKNRASFMWGSSTHNTRIERLWVEVGTQFARRWRAFFTRLGELHRLDRKNAHPVSGREAHDQTPADMRFLGQLTDGVYDEVDPMAGVDPDVINRYYGVEGTQRIQRRGQTGAGHPEDEGDDDDQDWIDEDLADAVENDLAHNIRHPAIKVARHRNPFRSRQIENGFFAGLQDIVRHGIVPEGFGVLETEWEDGDYPAVEAINPGTRGREIIVALPREIWLPRAILFAQALDAMTRALVFEEAELGVEDDEQMGYDSDSSQEDVD